MMDARPNDSLRPNGAAKFLGIGRSTLYKWAKERPEFPQPIKLGTRTTVFRLDELAAWRDAQGQKAGA
jgi:prophage regulatory protein